MFQIEIASTGYRFRSHSNETCHEFSFKSTTEKAASYPPTCGNRYYLIFLYDNTPKSEYYFDVLIDDAPSNLVDITSPKIGILFNQPWNKEFNWPLSVNTLSEAEQVIL